MTLSKQERPEHEAVYEVVSETLTQTQASWEAIYLRFKENFKEQFVLIDKNLAAYDLFLAATAFEMQTLKNLFPKDQAERIEKWILININTENWGKYAVEEIKQYSTQFQESIENIKKGSNPLVKIPARLLIKWLGHGIKNFEVKVPGENQATINPVVLMHTVNMLMVFTGKWKKIKEQYILTESELPKDII